MAGDPLHWLHDYCPGFTRLVRLPRQLLCISPFSGQIKPHRVKMFAPGERRPSQPFPHPWNYDKPLAILETYFWGTQNESEGTDKHHRYLECAGFGPVLVTRSPQTIRAILTQTSDRPEHFERDTLPSKGIARATGTDTLLYANGKRWWHQKKLAMPPFGRTSLFQPEQFHEFETTFRRTVRERLAALEQHIKESQPTDPGRGVEIALEPEIKAVMLEMLVNNFFGAKVSYDQIRNHYVPALDEVITHIVRDTVTNKLGLPLWVLGIFSSKHAQVKKSQAIFEELTDRVLAMRHQKEGQGQARGLWQQFKSDAPDSALRSNIRVFLAGALEATTSYASWAISHLARNQEAQQKLYDEVKNLDEYSPAVLGQATYLSWVMDETLRLTPSLYFLPRRAKRNMLIETEQGKRLNIPRDTHILLDVWHANRREDHWGKNITGHDAAIFKPERWKDLTPQVRKNKELLHFGFGHGPRICPGTHLGQLEVALVTGAFVKLFEFEAVHDQVEPKAGVSTKPSDGTLLRIKIRPTFVTSQGQTTTAKPQDEAPAPAQCPVASAPAIEQTTKNPPAGTCPFHSTDSPNPDEPEK